MSNTSNELLINTKKCNLQPTKWWFNTDISRPRSLIFSKHSKLNIVTWWQTATIGNTVESGRHARVLFPNGGFCRMVGQRRSWLTTCTRAVGALAQKRTLTGMNGFVPSLITVDNRHRCGDYVPNSTFPHNATAIFRIKLSHNVCACSSN